MDRPEGLGLFCEHVSPWATTLVPFPIPYGHLSAHIRTHYPHFNYEKTIKKHRS